MPNRAEYITAFSERKRVLASTYFCWRSFLSERYANLFRIPSQRLRKDAL